MTKLKAWLALIVSAIASVLAAWRIGKASGKRQGKYEETIKQKDEHSKAQTTFDDRVVDAVKHAQRVQPETQDDKADKYNRDNW